MLVSYENVNQMPDKIRTLLHHTPVLDFHQTERNISSHKIPRYPLYPNICGQTEIPVVAFDNENL